MCSYSGELILTHDCVFCYTVSVMKEKKIVLGVLAVLIILFGGYKAYSTYLKKVQQDGVKEVIQKTASIEEYDRSTKTLERLELGSVDDLRKLSDGSETQNTYIERLKNILSLLDSAKTEPDIADATMSVAFYLNLLGQKDKAIVQYEYFLTKRPGHSTTLDNLGFIYIDLKDYVKAEEYFKKNIEFSPNFSKGYIDLSDLYQTGMPEKKTEVVSVIQEGINKTKGQEKQTLVEYLAEFYDREKEYARALEQYQELLKINPNNEYIQQSIASLKKKLGNTKP